MYSNLSLGYIIHSHLSFLYDYTPPELSIINKKWMHYLVKDIVTGQNQGTTYEKL